jgi:nitrogen regulatory protein PII
VKFSVVVVLVPEEHEDRAIDKLKEAGAVGVTIFKGTGVGLKEKKTFFGMGFERGESMMVCVTERTVGFKILKKIRKELELDKHGNGLAFTLPLDHLVGLDYEQLQVLEEEREQ